MDVRKKLLNLMDNKLTVVVGGTTDFSCVNLEISKCTHFDLQAFYKRSRENGEPTGMSLRDAVSMEFGYDCQGIRPHSSTIGARATVQLFLDRYCKRMKAHAENWNRDYYEVFDDAVKLRQM